jgi:GTPase SAR1 family protein
MGVPKSAFTRLRLTIVGGPGAGKTSLIWAMTNGCFPRRFRPFLLDPLTIDVEFDPSSYLYECQGVTEMKESKAGHKVGGMESRRQTFELEIRDTITSEDVEPLNALYYMDSAVIALCFSVTERETFEMIKTRVRRVHATWVTCAFEQLVPDVLESAVVS